MPLTKISGGFSVQGLLKYGLALPSALLLALSAQSLWQVYKDNSLAHHSRVTNGIIEQSREVDYALTRELFMGLDILQRNNAAPEILNEFSEKAKEDKQKLDQFVAVVSDQVKTDIAKEHNLEEIERKVDTARASIIAHEVMQSESWVETMDELFSLLEDIRGHLLLPQDPEQFILHQQLVVRGAAQRLYQHTVDEAVLLNKVIAEKKLDDATSSRLTLVRRMADDQRRILKHLSDSLDDVSGGKQSSGVGMHRFMNEAQGAVLALRASVEKTSESFAIFDELRRQIYASTLLAGSDFVQFDVWQTELQKVLNNLKQVEYDTAQPLLQAIEQRQQQSKRQLVLTLAVVTLVALLVIQLFLIMRRRVLIPIGMITESMTKLAAGDASGDLPEAIYKDEVGKMIDAISIFRINAFKVQEQAQMLKMAELITGLGSWRMERGTQTVQWSDAVYKIHGVTPETYNPNLMSAIEFYHPDDRALVINSVNRALDEALPFTFEARLVRTDGAERYVVSMADVEKNAEGDVISVFGTFQDVTEKKRAEEELRRHRDHLQELVEEQTKEIREQKEKAEMANRAKTDFLANMSHELRTPLNSIIGMNRLAIESNQVPPGIVEMMETIDTSSHNLLEIVNDILDISKIEAGGIELEIIPFKPLDTLEKLASPLRPLASGKGLILQTDCMIDHSLTVMGDPTRWGRVIMNFMSNAIKYTNEGSVTLRAGVRHEGNEAIIRVDVIDTGIGIAANKLDSVFEKFVQADTTITRKYGGSGLGLAITKELTHLMKGKIFVESTVGKGSIFSVEVPFPLSDERAVQEFQNYEGILAACGTILPDEAQILIAEDHALNQMFLKRLLPSMGLLNFTIVENGRLALEAVQQKEYDIVLMDCHMPEMSGYEATKAIREFEKPLQKYTPIVAMTANAMIGEREKCLSVGMDDYISKPLDKDRFQNILSRWIKFPSVSSLQDGTIAARQSIDLPTLDKSVMATISGGREDIEREFAQIFTQQSEEQIVKLENLCIDGHSQEWKEVSHLLKGSAATLGAVAMSDICAQSQEMVEATADARREVLGMIKIKYAEVKAELVKHKLLEAA